MRMAEDPFRVSEGYFGETWLAVESIPLSLAFAVKEILIVYGTDQTCQTYLPSMVSGNTPDLRMLDVIVKGVS